MHDVLRQRLLRRIESLPEQQIYQVLDFIEFLESKYAQATVEQATGLQKFAENLEDKLRRKAVSPATIREAFQLISAADRVLSGVSNAGKQILSELGEAFEGPGQPPPRARVSSGPPEKGRSASATPPVEPGSAPGADPPGEGEPDAPGRGSSGA